MNKNPTLLLKIKMNCWLFKYLRGIEAICLRIVLKESGPVMSNQNRCAMSWADLIELIVQAKHQRKERLEKVMLHAPSEIRMQHV